MRVVFMGTPAFAVPALEALIGAKHEVVAVYSQPPRPAGRGLKLTPSPVHSVADAHGISVLTPASLKSPEAQAAFAAHKADVAVVAAYGLLLPQAVLDAPKHGCINIHPSDLPRWRGAAPLQRTLMAGDTETACCIIQLEAGLDTGPIHLREPFSIPAGMDAGELHDIMAIMGAKLTLQVLERLQSGRSNARAQAADGVTYAEKISKEERAIDWAKPARAVFDHIRGLSPSPAATFMLGDEVLKIYRAEIVPGDAKKVAGTILDGFAINCGDDSAIRPISLQRPGKNRQDLPQFLASFPIKPGVSAK